MRKPITVAEILSHVSAKTGITIEELKGPRRIKRITPYRHMAYYLAKKLTTLSYPQIGKVIGGRDHSTIIHGCEQCEIRMSRDPEFMDMVFSLRNDLIDGVVAKKFNAPLPDLLLSGDRIRHPRYGLGEVIGCSPYVIDGKETWLYTMRFSKVTLRVPKHKIKTIGICKIIDTPPEELPKLPESLVASLMRKVSRNDDDEEPDLDDIEWLSRRVAAHYA